MKCFYLEEVGIIVEFNPGDLSMTFYIYGEKDKISIVDSISDLRAEYKKLINAGYTAFDPSEIIGTKPILENTFEQDEIEQAEIEAIERSEFYTIKPDDWAHK